MKKLRTTIIIVLLPVSLIVLIIAMLYDYIKNPSSREGYSGLKKMWSNRGNWLELETSRFFSRFGEHRLEFLILEPLAKKGFDPAQNNLGRAYYYGRGAPQNYKKAAEWYKKSAEQGNPNAQNNLGLMYADGLGVFHDADEAIKWFRRSATQSHGYTANAQHNLGTVYALREGSPKYDILAYMWFSIAKANGDKKDVEKALATLRDRMPPKDIEKAEEMAMQCWESGYKNCNDN